VVTDGALDGICQSCTEGAIVDNDTDDDGVCDADEVVGCQDETACNYNDAATDSGDCTYTDGICESCSGEQDGSGTIVDNDTDDDSVCDADEVVGCQDETACNYNDAATDSGDCAVPTACDTCAGFTRTGNGSGSNEPVVTVDLAPDVSGTVLTINSVTVELSDECGGNTWPTISFSSNSCGLNERIINNSEGNSESIPNNTAKTWANLIYTCDTDVSDWTFTIEEIDNPDCAYTFDYTIIGSVTSGTDDGTGTVVVTDGTGTVVTDGALDGICQSCTDGAIVDNDTDDDTVCDADEVVGCQDSAADNYSALATDAGDCTYTPVAPELLTPTGGQPFTLTANQDLDATFVDFTWTASSYAGDATDVLTYLVAAMKMTSAEILAASVSALVSGDYSAITDNMVVFEQTTDTTYSAKYSDLDITNGSADNNYSWYVVVTTGTFPITADPSLFTEEILGVIQEFSIDASDLAIDEYVIPTEFSVYQNYPNPFNPSTTFEFDVATPTNVSLLIYDLTGKEVYSLASGYHLPGRYSVVWNAIDSNGGSVSSGMYIYQLRTSDAVVTKKLVLIR